MIDQLLEEVPPVVENGEPAGAAVDELVHFVYAGEFAQPTRAHLEVRAPQQHGL